MPAGDVSAREVPFTEGSVINGSAFSRPESAFPSDIDGDGDTDIVAAASVEGAVAWWENNGGEISSNWTVHVIDNSFPGANSVVALDLDGDGDQDVVATAGGITDVIAWWENVDGDGLNWSKITIDPFFDGARSVSVRDIDSDGLPDIIACANTAGEAAWWRQADNTGTNWVKRTIATGFNGANACIIDDMDRDGKMDVVGAAAVDNTVVWWRNASGAGTNWTSQVISTSATGVQSLAVSDLDGDGDLDVSGTFNRVPDGQVVWWENTDGAGTAWTSHVVVANLSGAYGITTGDLDSDGDEDILVTAQTADDVAWLENIHGNASGWIMHTIDGLVDGARDVRFGDLDGDGDPDIVAAAFIQNQIVSWENRTIHRATAFCSEQVISANFRGAQSLSASDLDRDGDEDILAAASVDNRISWWENTDASGGIWLERTIDTNFPSAWSITHADLDRDGVPDVLAASRSAHTIAWWRDIDGSRINWERRVIDNSFSLVQSIAAADFDRDGDDDVIGASYGSGEIGCWLNQTAGSNWIKVTVATGMAGANSVVAADINGDGSPDIVGSAFLSGSVTWWENSGTATQWTPHVIDANFSGAMSVFATDMDRDGDIDVVGASFNQDRIIWWENDGGSGTSWISHLVDTDIDGASVVHVADLDADGDPDVLGGSSVVNRFAWWENIDATGTNWIRSDLLTDTVDASHMIAADFNSDGRPDVAGASGNASVGIDPNVIVWLNGGGQYSLTGTNALAPDVLPGSTVVVQSITFTHRGRAGDSDIELASLPFLMERSPGSFLDNDAAENLIKTLYIYRDSGSGQFEEEEDNLVTLIDSFVLTNGVQTLEMDDGDELLRCTVSNSATFFVVMELNQGVSNQPFRITLLDEQSIAEDRGHDIALDKQCDDQTTVSIAMTRTLADVAIGISASPDLLVTGSNIIYTITVTNQGDQTAYDVLILDPLPSFTTADLPGSSAECTVTGNVVTCLVGSLTQDQVRTFTIATFVSGQATGAVVNTASIITTSIDTNEANDMATATVPLPDSDDDGSADFADSDDDNDGMPDEWEWQFGFNRTNSTDAAGDQDADGYFNVEEYIAGSNPTNPASYFTVDDIIATSQANVVVVSFTGRVYSLQFNEDVGTGSWSNITGQVDIPGSGGPLTLIDPESNTGRNYRIKVRIP